MTGFWDWVALWAIVIAVGAAVFLLLLGLAQLAVGS